MFPLLPRAPDVYQDCADHTMFGPRMYEYYVPLSGATEV